MSRKRTPSSDDSPEEVKTGDAQREDGVKKPLRNGGWQRIEALRERAALKASLADVWDEDFDLDEEILADLDHTAEFFTTQVEDDEEELLDDDDELDDFFDEDDDDT
ncbi:MAG: hypothetical protein P8Y54_00630 [Xanthomonadales bacterium]